MPAPARAPARAARRAREGRSPLAPAHAGTPEQRVAPGLEPAVTRRARIAGERLAHAARRPLQALAARHGRDAEDLSDLIVCQPVDVVELEHQRLLVGKALQRG